MHGGHVTTDAWGGDKFTDMNRTQAIKNGHTDVVKFDPNLYGGWGLEWTLYQDFYTNMNANGAWHALWAGLGYKVPPSWGLAVSCGGCVDAIKLLNANPTPVKSPPLMLELCVTGSITCE